MRAKLALQFFQIFFAMFYYKCNDSHKLERHAACRKTVEHGSKTDRQLESDSRDRDPDKQQTTDVHNINHIW